MHAPLLSHDFHMFAAKCCCNCEKSTTRDSSLLCLFARENVCHSFSQNAFYLFSFDKWEKDHKQIITTSVDDLVLVKLVWCLNVDKWRAKEFWTAAGRYVQNGKQTTRTHRHTQYAKSKTLQQRKKKLLLSLIENSPSKILNLFIYSGYCKWISRAHLFDAKKKPEKKESWKSTGNRATMDCVRIDSIQVSWYPSV